VLLSLSREYGPRLYRAAKLQRKSSSNSCADSGTLLKVISGLRVAYLFYILKDPSIFIVIGLSTLSLSDFARFQLKLFRQSAPIDIHMSMNHSHVKKGQARRRRDVFEEILD
jgi:hypothetical protein